MSTTKLPVKPRVASPFTVEDERWLCGLLVDQLGRWSGKESNVTAAIRARRMLIALGHEPSMAPTLFETRRHLTAHRLNMARGAAAD